MRPSQIISDGKLLTEVHEEMDKLPLALAAFGQSSGQMMIRWDSEAVWLSNDEGSEFDVELFSTPEKDIILAITNALRDRHTYLLSVQKAIMDRYNKKP